MALRTAGKFATGEFATGGFAALTAFQGAMPTPICPTPSTPDLAGVISVCQGWGHLCGPGTNGRLKMPLGDLFAPTARFATG